MTGFGLIIYIKLVIKSHSGYYLFMALIRMTVICWCGLVWTWASAVDIVVVTHAKTKHVRNKISALGHFLIQKFKWGRLMKHASIPKLLFLIKSSTKILKILYSCSLILLILSIIVPNLVTIGRHLTSFLTCATFNM